MGRGPGNGPPPRAEKAAGRKGTSDMTKREEARLRAETEAVAAERYAAAAWRHAQAGRTSAAWAAADTARCAATCATQAHDDLWAAAKGELTAEEFDAFEAAEAASLSAHAAERIATGAVTRTQTAQERAAIC